MTTRENSPFGRLCQTVPETPFPENGMTVAFVLPGFCRPVHTAGTQLRRGAGFNEVLKG